MRKMKRKTGFTMISVLLAASMLLGGCGNSNSNKSGVSKSYDVTGDVSEQYEADMALDTETLPENESET